MKLTRYNTGSRVLKNETKLEGGKYQYNRQLNKDENEDP